MKTCTICGTEKPLEDFYKKAAARDGRASQCKPCDRDRTKEYRSRPEVQAKRREYRNSPEGREKRREYANSPEGREKQRERGKRYRAKQREYWNSPEGQATRRDYYFTYRFGRTRKEIFDEYGPDCNVCGKTLDIGSKGAHVDHDHACCPGDRRTCGKCVRGLLCNHCNSLLGFAKDDPVILAKASTYLLQRSSVRPPGLVDALRELVERIRDLGKAA